MRPIRPLALLACTLLSLAALAGDEPKKAEPAGSEAEMQAYAKANQPTEAHKRLADMAGKWTFVTKMWMDPSQPPTVSEGTSEVTVIMDGRFIQEEHRGTMMGQSFRGLGLIGYDNQKKQYVSTWVDNMTTQIMMQTGEWDAAQNAFVYRTEMDDPKKVLTGDGERMRHIKITSVDGIPADALRELVKQAVKLNTAKGNPTLGR